MTVTATDFGHPEGRRYQVAVQEMLELPDVSLESKKKIQLHIHEAIRHCSQAANPFGLNGRAQLALQ